MAVAQSLAARDGGTAGAAMYKVPLQEKDVQALQEQLLRERSERQRAAQLCKAQDEELKRRERLNSSLWEQRVRLERDASELRGRLARVESQQQKEVQELQLQLRRAEALRERDQSELQREVALHQAAADHARRQLTQARLEAKDREVLEQEIQELRLELTQAKSHMQVRLREQEAEFQRQCLELRATRMEEEKRRQRREDVAMSPPDSVLPRAALRPATSATAVTNGGVDISRIEGGSLEDVSTLSEGAVEAISKMKLLEDQLRSWQGMTSTLETSVVNGVSHTAGPVEERPEVSACRREAELLLEMQQEHLLAIRLSRRAMEVRRSAEFRLVRSASLPNSILDSVPFRLAHSPISPSKQVVSVPRSEPCLQRLEASPNSAGAVLGSSRGTGGNVSAGSPPREFVVQPREEAKEPSPCSCQALSPALSLEAATADRPEISGAGPVDLVTENLDTRCGGTSSPARAAAGRLPPLAGVEKPAERGTIGPLAVPDLSPSRRPEIDTAEIAQIAAAQSEEPTAALDARLKEVELDRASWRRRTLLLEEQMQRLLLQQSAKEEVRWRPEALQLEDEGTAEMQEAWKQEKQTLEAQLSQVVAERDRMIEATNELRADVRRLSQSREVVVTSTRPLPAPAVATAPMPSPVEVMRQALEEGPVRQAVDHADRFGVSMRSASSSPRHRGTPGTDHPPVMPAAPPAPQAPARRVTLSLPIPAAGTPGAVAATSRRAEVEVPGSATLSRSPSPPGWPPPSPETVTSWGPCPVPPPHPVAVRNEAAPWEVTWRSQSPSEPPSAPAGSVEGDASPAALRVRDALRMLSPRSKRTKSTSPNQIR